MKFKVGDRVYCKLDGETEYIIEKYDDSDGTYRCKQLNSELSYWIAEANLIPVRKCRFKVGDKVVAKSNTPYEITTNGWTGEVVEILSGSKRGDDMVVSTRRGENFWVESKYFNAVPTFQQIKAEKMNCVIKVNSVDEAIGLRHCLPSRLSLFESELFTEERIRRDYKLITDYINEGRPHHCDESVYSGTPCFSIENGKMAGFCDEGYFTENPEYGTIYEFTDIVKASDMQAGGVIYATETESEEKYNAKMFAINKDKSCVVSFGSVKLDNKLFDDVVSSFAKCPTIKTEISTTATSQAIQAEVERICKRLGIGCTVKTMDEFKKEENNMNFWTETGERYESLGKHKGKTIPTITTFVEYNGRIGSATCDTTDYNERQGVLEALANSVCGNFDRKYNAVKKLKDKEYKLNCTCGFCGKVCDAPEGKAEHEQEHIERKKAKRERYLLRKRAKEIAFEQAAQEMAKTIAKEEK